MHFIGAVLVAAPLPNPPPQGGREKKAPAPPPNVGGAIGPSSFLGARQVCPEQVCPESGLTTLAGPRPAPANCAKQTSGWANAVPPIGQRLRAPRGGGAHEGLDERGRAKSLVSPGRPVRQIRHRAGGPRCVRAGGERGGAILDQLARHQG